MLNDPRWNIKIVKIDNKPYLLRYGNNNIIDYYEISI